MIQSFILAIKYIFIIGGRIMDKKIIVIGILSMFLLVNLNSISYEGTLSEIEMKDYENFVGKNIIFSRQHPLYWQPLPRLPKELQK